MVAKSGLCVAAMLSAFTELAPSFGIRANSLCTYAAVFNLLGFFQPKLFVFLGRNVNELMNARAFTVLDQIERISHIRNSGVTRNPDDISADGI
jgi:hypothetical protein